MKKFIVSVLIIGAFVLYSFIYHRSSTVAALPGNTTKSSSSSSSSVTTPTPTSTLPPSTAAQITPTSPTPTPTSAPGGLYKNGSYTGSVADAHWGYIQVKVIVTNGKITDVQFLQYPSDRNRSVEINQYADPQLTTEAIQVQSANVDIVSGATDSSDAFIQSLTDALTQAKA